MLPAKLGFGNEGREERGRGGGGGLGSKFSTCKLCCILWNTCQVTVKRVAAAVMLCNATADSAAWSVGDLATSLPHAYNHVSLLWQYEHRLVQICHTGVVCVYR